MDKYWCSKIIIWWLGLGCFGKIPFWTPLSQTTSRGLRLALFLRRCKWNLYTRFALCWHRGLPKIHHKQFTVARNKTRGCYAAFLLTPACSQLASFLHIFKITWAGGANQCENIQFVIQVYWYPDGNAHVNMRYKWGQRENMHKHSKKNVCSVGSPECN